MESFRRRRALVAVGSAALAVSLGSAGCAPALDWREFDPEDAGLHVAFPCRPERSVREVPVGGPGAASVPRSAPPTAASSAPTAPMTMLSCEAGGRTFAIGWVDLGDPAAAPPVMRAWRRAAAARLGASDAAPGPLAVPGASPNAEAGAVRLAGRLPDGRGVEARLAWFARGARVWQAGAVGPAEGAEAAAEPFFTALRAGDGADPPDRVSGPGR